MTTSASSTTSVFPGRKEFEDSLRNNKWEKLLWMPYEEHLPELTLVLNAVDTREDAFWQWILNRDTFDEAGTKTWMDLVARFFYFLDFSTRLFKGGRGSEFEDKAIPSMGIVLTDLHRLTILSHGVAEVESFRDEIFSRLILSITQLANFFTPLKMTALLPCLSYSFYDEDDRFRGEVFERLNVLFDKDDATRERFVSRCKLELEAVVSMADGICGEGYLHSTMHNTAITLAMHAVTTILMASRFVKAGRYSGLVITVRIPPALTEKAQACFKRIFELCLRFKMFERLEEGVKQLGCAIAALPELWTSSEALPLYLLLQAIWCGLALDDRHLSKDFPAMLNIATTLRNLAYTFRKEPRLIDCIETRLAAFAARSGKLSRSLVEEHGKTMRSPSPVLAVLVGKMTKRILELRSFPDDPTDTKVYLVRMELFLNILLIDASSSNIFLYDVMTMQNGAILRSLGELIMTTVADCERRLAAASGQGTSAAKSGDGLFPRTAFVFRTMLNVLNRLLQNDEIRKYFLALTTVPELAKRMVQALQIAKRTDTMQFVDKRVGLAEKKMTLRDRRLSMYSGKFCALSIVSLILSDADAGTVQLDRSVMPAMFEAAAAKDVTPDDASMAILALARIVKDAPAEWKRLQGMSMKDGRKLSDLTARACDKDAGCTSRQVPWNMEALAIFQYMAENNDDDGNSRAIQTEFKSLGELPRRPITSTVMMFRGESDKTREQDMRTTRWAFRLFGNYGANMARRNCRPFGEDELSSLHSYILVQEMNIMFSWYLTLPEDTLIRNLETTTFCYFAGANLSASSDQGFKKLFSGMVEFMAIPLRNILKNGHRLDEKEEAMMDDLCASAAKAISNVAACGEEEMEWELLIDCVLTLLKDVRKLGANPLRETSFYALLALYKLMRKSPERKAMMVDLGAVDELRAWYSLTAIHGGPWSDLVLAIIWTFISDNLRMVATPFCKTVQELRAAMPRRRPFSEVLLEIKEMV